MVRGSPDDDAGWKDPLMREIYSIIGVFVKTLPMHTFFCDCCFIVTYSVLF